MFIHFFRIFPTDFGVLGSWSRSYQRALSCSPVWYDLSALLPCFCLRLVAPTTILGPVVGGVDMLSSYNQRTWHPQTSCSPAASHSVPARFLRLRHRPALSMGTSRLPGRCAYKYSIVILSRMNALAVEDGRPPSYLLSAYYRRRPPYVRLTDALAPTIYLFIAGRSRRSLTVALRSTTVTPGP